MSQINDTIDKAEQIILMHSDMIYRNHTSAQGKLRTVVTKITVALLTAVISYTLIYLPYYVNL